jgi:hypothetical protein
MAVVAAQSSPPATSAASSTTSPQAITVTGASPRRDDEPGRLASFRAVQHRSAGQRAAEFGDRLHVDANCGRELGMHLNHKVQITGTVDTATTSSATSTQPSSPNSSSAMPALRVTSVKMVSSTCP